MITPNVIEREWVQGCNVHVENLTGTAFSGENGAHTFKIRGVDADGQPVAISGSVLAKVLRADNVTVDVAGSVVDGVAEVTMVGDCYHVPGRASIVIFLSDGTNTVTLYAAVFNVYRSTSGNEIDSGVNIPSLAELLAQIERMETATAAAEAATNRAEHLLDTSETTAWNQLVQNGNFESTSGWKKYSNHTFAVENGEITLTVSSSSTRSRIYREDLPTTVVGHKLYAHAELKASENEQPLYLRVGGEDIKKSGYDVDTWYVLDDVIEASIESDVITLAYGLDNSHRLPTGGTLSARNVWAVDLTAIYGEGNEPTAEEFRQAYPHRYYDYAAIGSVRTLDITEVHGAELLGKVDIQQNVADAGKILGIGADGRVTPVTGGSGGGVSDVQINGTSVVSGGVANVPIATNGGSAGAFVAKQELGISYSPGLRGHFIADPDATEITARSSAKYKAITLHTFDKAVKAAMTDGVGAAWTDAEKAAARQRMGIGAYELIETITLDEDVSSIVRDKEPDNTPYNFDGIVIVVDKNNATVTSNVSGWCRINDGQSGDVRYAGNTNIVRTDMNNTVFCFERTLFGHMYSFAAFYSTASYTATPAPAVLPFNWSVFNEKIHNFNLYTTSGGIIPSGVKISIYGVRA